MKKLNSKWIIVALLIFSAILNIRLRKEKNDIQENLNAELFLYQNRLSNVERSAASQREDIARLNQIIVDLRFTPSARLDTINAQIRSGRFDQAKGSISQLCSVFPSSKEASKSDSLIDVIEKTIRQNELALTRACMSAYKQFPEKKNFSMPGFNSSVSGFYFRNTWTEYGGHGDDVELVVEESTSIIKAKQQGTLRILLYTIDKAGTLVYASNRENLFQTYEGPVVSDEKTSRATTEHSFVVPQHLLTSPLILIGITDGSSVGTLTADDIDGKNICIIKRLNFGKNVANPRVRKHPGERVYIIDTGNCYHSFIGCSGQNNRINSIKAVTKSYAISCGYRGCKRC